MTDSSRCVVAFDGFDLIARGALLDVAASAKQVMDGRHAGPVLLFDAATSAPVEVDFRGTVADVLARLSPPVDQKVPARAPGRPRLGVVAREVTLLPAHWDWLASQRSGASATLRRLVEHAARVETRGGSVRRARDVTYRFMTQLAGDLPGYESALRALYAGDAVAFAREIAGWPAGVRAHTEQLAADAFSHG